ncbi:PREDICTED: immunoglobulin superfamily member 10-like [Papilio xuthus]|uniref:Immunoglobulin superfamily member 10-like n=1 Tax=Papilio xuthus TaxID=66420 RepID=A0AAJ6ZF17_PAPXU|nr:PREDICTED: immunoglobulin superfamily member 10-like [Papilio xuthus]
MNIINKDDQFYISEPIVFPKDTFKVLMIAEDEKTKETIKRTSLPIEPQQVFPDSIKDEAPKVTITGDSKVTSSYGSPLQLTCRVTGHPKPNILWTDDDGSTLKFTVTTLKEEYEFVSVLEIDKVNKKNTYVCKATNSISSDEKSVEVEMSNYFDVVNLSKDKIIEYNTEDKLYCKVNANPPVNVTWYLNGKIIVNDDNLSITSDQSTLLIKKMKPEHVGKILCEIRNDVKRIVHDLQLTIIGVEAPKIDNKITEIYANKGSSAKISCRILKGDPKPTIQWYFKAKNKDSFYPIKEYKEDINIDKVTANVVGTYKCIAKNEIDKDSHIVDLIMEYSPVIMDKEYIDILKRMGETITISCKIHGEPAPEIHWSINGIKVEDTELYKIYRDHTLTFKASIKTMGMYTCEGVNKLGSIKYIANVSVFEPVSFDVPKTLTIKIRLRRTLDITCPVKGYPTPLLRWEFHSRDGTKRRILSEKAQLVIPAIAVNDHGLYVCIAKNPDGKEKSIAYVVNVEVPPSITPEEKEIVAIKDDIGIRIPCNSSGNPKPKISWIYKGNPLAIGNEYYSMESDGTLLIKNVKESVAGTYACVAESELGKVFENFKVVINKYPIRGGIVGEEYLVENKPAVVKCNVPHTSTDQILWYKGRFVVARGDLIFKKYRNSRSGLYKCRVSNYYKSITGNVRIKTVVKPRFVYSHTKQTFMFYEPDLCLTCGNSASPKTEISWWKNKRRIVYSGDTYCCKNSVTSIGEYECVVENKFGKISRKFYVKADDCLLDIKEDLEKYHPLILNQDYKVSDFSIKDGHLAIPIGNKVQFFCQGGFNKFTDSILIAECMQSHTFKINDEEVDYTKLKCKEALKQVTIKTKEDCAKGNGEVYRIGIYVKEFMEMYQICYHKILKIPLYGEYNLTTSAAGVSCASPEIWFNDDVINYNKDEMYDCKQQRNDLTTLIGRDLPGKEDECFGSRQLVNEKDLPAGFPQILAHSYLNIVPQWNSDSMKNWDILEEILRTEVKKRHRSFTKSNIYIRTGVSQRFRLSLGKSKVRSDIYIKDKAGNKILPPVYIWKVITDQFSAATVAIIQVMVPESLRRDNTKDYEICENQCDKIQWLKGIDVDYLNSGNMFCCSINDFEKAFRYPVAFSMGYTKILSIISS